ncbi:hypothetical protein WA026_020136 [Henosepilachna vigintioctopunctata]|uniref:HAT C-terminal dimerisation domain-containing protein n=1 Tax=Henosepilachna vigintioctopunctata TaxID=420089 RepID=A0AAW1UB11_9CUCU
MYIEKLQLWRRKIAANPCNYSNFAKIMSISDEPQFKEVFEGSQMKSLILNHLENLTEEFRKYFPDTCDDGIYRLSTDPFNININSLPEALQEEGLEIKHDSSAKYDFDKRDKSSFWIKYFKVYPRVSQAAIRLYLPFSSIYLCEKAFSTLVAIETKFRNNFDVTSDLRCALTKTQPRIGLLVKKMQAHSSH